MAKLLVLFDGGEDVLTVSEWVHDGARGVRFAEADLMRLPGEAESPRVTRVRMLESPEALLPYDAIALGASAGLTAGLTDLLDRIAPLGMKGALANKLGAVIPGTDPAATGGANPLWDLLAPMARYGMILVPPGYAGPTGEPEDRQAASRRLGKRLIDIAAWITHARSHEH